MHVKHILEDDDMFTPLELDGITFKKSALGYNAQEVDKFMGKIIADYEKLYRENIELKDKMTVLNEGIQYYKTMEKTLQDTLISAEKSASEVRNAAQKKSEVIESEAELRAKQIIGEAKNELYAINQQIMDLQNCYENTRKEMVRTLNSQLDLLGKDTYSHIAALGAEKDKLAIGSNEEKKDNKVQLFRLDEEGAL